MDIALERAPACLVLEVCEVALQRLDRALDIGEARVEISDRGLRRTNRMDKPETRLLSGVLALAELAAEYDVDRKTIRRRLDAAELAEAERARRRAAKRAEEKRMRRLLGSGYRNPERAPEHAARPASRAGRRRASGGRILRLDRPSSYADWLDERDARLSAAPDPHVQLMTDSGKTIASTRESNAERMSAALEPRFGPLTTVPA